MDEIEPDYDGRIAVIGMAGRFPGSPNIDAFWSNLRAGVEAIRLLTEDELLAAGESLDNIRDPAYVPAAAPLEDIDQFDAGFFGMSPRDAAVFDPQHRMFLESAWQAFEHAGYVGEDVEGAVGVFASCGMSEYMFKNVLANAQLTQSIGEWLIRHTGNDTNFLATRVSYELDLKGPSMNVQTACSSTLVAIHLACQSLLSGECDMALAGGAVVAPVQRRGYFYKEGEILSPDGHCRTFDAKSAGTVISSAVGCVLLKPLAAAMADGDNVLAVIRGSAINNDGREKVGYLAPSVGGQAQAVAEALAVSGVDPRDVSYVEAHGTGTLIGDPIEIAGITQAYRESTDDTQFCAIGSLKSNIGHTGEAAGVAAFIKTVLSLQHREIPPSLHYDTPNPQADFPSSPFFVNAELRPWNVDPGKTRIAGITGLGAGGTNAHVLVEEAPAREASGPATRDTQLITLSARTAEGVDRAAAELADHLRANPDLALADVAYTRLVGRKAFPVRRAIAASTATEAAARLGAADQRTSANGVAAATGPSVVYLMPGGGAQYAGMGRELYEREPVYRDAVDACCASVNRMLGLDLRTVMYPDGDIGEGSKRLERPSVALPALFTTEYAMAKLLESWGVAPAAMIGHSAGEYAVACVAGVISMEDGLALVATRGRLFETLPSGSMLSVSLPEAEARERMLDGLSIAAINAPDLCVMSGPTDLIAEMEGKLAGDDVDTMRVHIDVAAHSAMLEPILAEFRAFCRTIHFAAPTIPYVSNLTGTWVTERDVTDPEYWVRHLCGAVRFGDGIETILADPNRVLVEIGPGRTLATFSRMASVTPAMITPTLRHPQEEFSDLAFAMLALGRVWSAGVDIDPTILFPDEVRHRLPLPTYPFDHQRYWVDPDATPARGSRAPGASGVLRKKPDVADWFSTPSWRRSVPPPASVLATPKTWLLIADGSQLLPRMKMQLLSAGHRVFTVSFGAGFVGYDDRFEINTDHGGNFVDLFESLRLRDIVPDCVVHLTALGRPRGRGGLMRATPDPQSSLTESVAQDFSSLLELAMALSVYQQPTRLAVITSGVHVLGGERDVRPERALLHGACRVIPRELTHVSSVAIDIDGAATRRGGHDRLVERLLSEIAADSATDDVVAYRGIERWVRTFDPVSLPPAATTSWKSNGIYLITGGLGGIGLSVAEHIAAAARGATLVLVGRSPVPTAAATDSSSRQKWAAIERLRSLGATVVPVSADITDAVAMQAVLDGVRERHGRITGVIHSAGVLDDSLIALRARDPFSAVLSVKATGVLVIDQLLAKAPPELILLFSSVSSLIGLPGQVDYTAANAFLDAYAARKNVEGVSRTIVVNWSAWQSVGMAVDAAHAEAARRVPLEVDTAPADPVQLFDRVEELGDEIVCSTAFSRARHWLLDEHVVRGGDALIPGTGYIELMRLAAVHGHDPVPQAEISDVVFMKPFFVGPDETRTLHVKLHRRSGDITVYSDDEDDPHATGNAVRRTIDEAPVLDLTAIRRRCTVRSEVWDGYSDQPFMQFGPRWGNLRRVDYGHGEALIATSMPDRFATEIDSLWLHPGLLDMAIGNAQSLMPDFSDTESFYVPFGYGRVTVREPLPVDAESHVVLRPSQAADLAVFDISICDLDGTEVARVDGFTMRRVPAGSAFVSGRDADAPAQPSRSTAPVQAAVREGILPEEGVDALDRLLAAEIGGQVAVCSVDLDEWIAHVDADASAAASDGDADSLGPQFARPNLRSAFSEPANELERELATMMGELLGIQQVGRDDDFFELGGQSLIAVRLFARLRRRYAFEMPLSTLFEAPTVARLAALIGEISGEPLDTAAGAATAAAAVAPPKWRHLVAMHGNLSGPGAPLFIVHGMFGNVVNFRFLAAELAAGRPVYGVQARGLYGGEAAHDSFEEAAEAYLDEVRQVQPTGPYQFAGYSGGGIIAIEMARWMRAAGEQVADVILLDTWAPMEVTLSPLDRVRMQIGIARSRGAGYVRQWIVAKYRWERAHRLQRFSKHQPEERTTAAAEDGTVAAGFFRAAGAYRLTPYDGGVAMFRPAPGETFSISGGRRIDEFHRVIDEANGWTPWCARVTVFEVAGDHATMIEPPNVHGLATLIDGVLTATTG